MIVSALKINENLEEQVERPTAGFPLILPVMRM